MSEPLKDALEREGRIWTLQVDPPLATRAPVYPMKWGGLRQFTREPGMAADYTLEGAKACATRLRRTCPDHPDCIHVVKHPVCR